MTIIATPARRHRRPGRLRQDGADARAVPRAARPLPDRRRHQRHLHRGGRAVPRAQRGARRRTASSASKPAAARTRRSARMRRSISRRSTASRSASAISTSSSSKAAATISPRRSRPELSDLTLYVIDVAAGDKIPRKGGPGITRSDLLVINKIDLAPMVGASLEVMDRDARRMRGERPFVFTNLKSGAGARYGHPLCRRARHAGCETRARRPTGA